MQENRTSWVKMYLRIYLLKAAVSVMSFMRSLLSHFFQNKPDIFDIWRKISTEWTHDGNCLMGRVFGRFHVFLYVYILIFPQKLR
jgi:hypothetical protein